MVFVLKKNFEFDVYIQEMTLNINWNLPHRVFGKYPNLVTGRFGFENGYYEEDFG